MPSSVLASLQQVYDCVDLRVGPLVVHHPAVKVDAGGAKGEREVEDGPGLQDPPGLGVGAKVEPHA